MPRKQKAKPGKGKGKGSVSQQVNVNVYTSKRGGGGGSRPVQKPVSHPVSQPVSYPIFQAPSQSNDLARYNNMILMNKNYIDEQLKTLLANQPVGLPINPFLSPSQNQTLVQQIEQQTQTNPIENEQAIGDATDIIIENVQQPIPLNDAEKIEQPLISEFFKPEKPFRPSRKSIDDYRNLVLSGNRGFSNDEVIEMMKQDVRKNQEQYPHRADFTALGEILKEARLNKLQTTRERVEPLSAPSQQQELIPELGKPSEMPIAERENMFQNVIEAYRNPPKRGRRKKSKD